MTENYFEILLEFENNIKRLNNFITDEEEKTDFMMHNICTPEFLDQFKLKVNDVSEDLTAVKRGLTPENIIKVVTKLNDKDNITADDITSFLDTLLYQLFTVQSNVNTIKHRLTVDDRYYQLNLYKIIGLNYFNSIDTRLTNLLYEILTYKEPLNKLEVFKEKYERLNL